MKSLILSLFLISSVGLAQEVYTVTKVIESLTAKDYANHRTLKIKPPEVLYPWLSVRSAYRLFTGYSLAKPFPMKRFSNGDTHSLISFKAPSFENEKGLFAWHNPLGATVGGSGEVYGDNEAVLALKISPEAKVGLIVSNDGVFSQNSQRLEDPQLAKKYDLVLHVTAMLVNGKVFHSFIEWIIINPEIITEFTLDSKIVSAEMEKYKKLSQKTIGPQHFGLYEQIFATENINGLIEKINVHNQQLDELSFSRGWHSRPSACRKTIK